MIVLSWLGCKVYSCPKSSENHRGPIKQFYIVVTLVYDEWCLDPLDTWYTEGNHEGPLLSIGRTTFVIDWISELDGVVVILERLPNGFYFSQFFFEDWGAGVQLKWRPHFNY